MNVTLEDNHGNVQTVELDGLPEKGDRIDGIAIGTQIGSATVKEKIWEAGGGVTVRIVDGFVAR